MPHVWEVVHKLLVHTENKGYEFEVFVPTKPLVTYFMTVTCHDQYGPNVIEEYEFETLEEAKEFVKKWSPKCEECLCDPCTCEEPTTTQVTPWDIVDTPTNTPRVLTANHEDEFIDAIKKFFTEKNCIVTVAINDETPVQMWSGVALMYLLGYLSTYGEWSMEYSLLKNKVIGQVNTFEGAFQFSIERN
jgi:hypothetical protein